MKLTNYTLQGYNNWIKENNKNIETQNEDDLIIEYLETLGAKISKKNGLYELNIENRRYSAITKEKAIKYSNENINHNCEIFKKIIKEYKKNKK